jgi:hypothetical protein
VRLRKGERDTKAYRWREWLQQSKRSRMACLVSAQAVVHFDAHRSHLVHGSTLRRKEARGDRSRLVPGHRQSEPGMRVIQPERPSSHHIPERREKDEQQPGPGLPAGEPFEKSEHAANSDSCDAQKGMSCARRRCGHGSQQTPVMSQRHGLCGTDTRHVAQSRVMWQRHGLCGTDTSVCAVFSTRAEEQRPRISCGNARRRAVLPDHPC